MGDVTNSMDGSERNCQATVLVLFCLQAVSPTSHSILPHTTPSSSAMNSLLWKQMTRSDSADSIKVFRVRP